MQLLQLSIKNSRSNSNLRKKRENTKRLQKAPLPKKRSNNSKKGKGLPRQNCQWITVFVNVTEREKKRIAKLKSLRSFDKMLHTPNVRGKCSFLDLYFLRLIVKNVRTVLRSRKIVYKPDDSSELECSLQEDEKTISKGASFKKKQLRVHLGKSKFLAIKCVKICEEKHNKEQFYWHVLNVRHFGQI